MRRRSGGSHSERNSLNLHYCLQPLMTFFFFSSFMSDDIGWQPTTHFFAVCLCYSFQLDSLESAQCPLFNRPLELV
jgi:hypothetical protein